MTPVTDPAKLSLQFLTWHDAYRYATADVISKHAYELGQLKLRIDDEGYWRVEEAGP